MKVTGLNLLAIITALELRADAYAEAYSLADSMVSHRPLGDDMPADLADDDPLDIVEENPAVDDPAVGELLNNDIGGASTNEPANNELSDDPNVNATAAKVDEADVPAVEIDTGDAGIEGLAGQDEEVTNATFEELDEVLEPALVQAEDSAWPSEGQALEQSIEPDLPTARLESETAPDQENVVGQDAPENQSVDKGEPSVVGDPADVMADVEGCEEVIHGQADMGESDEVVEGQADTGGNDENQAGDEMVEGQTDVGGIDEIAEGQAAVAEDVNDSECRDTSDSACQDAINGGDAESLDGMVSPPEQLEPASEYEAVSDSKADEGAGEVETESLDGFAVGPSENEDEAPLVASEVPSADSAADPEIVGEQGGSLKETIFKGMSDEDAAETAYDVPIVRTEPSPVDDIKVEWMSEQQPLGEPQTPAPAAPMVDRVANDDDLAIAAANVRKAWLLLEPRSIPSLVQDEGPTEVGLPMRIAMLASVLSDIINEMDALQNIDLHYIKGQSLVTTTTTTTTPKANPNGLMAGLGSGAYDGFGGGPNGSGIGGFGRNLPFGPYGGLYGGRAMTRPPVLTSPFSSLWPNGSIPRLGVSNMHPAPINPHVLNYPIFGRQLFDEASNWNGGERSAVSSDDSSIQFGNRLHTELPRDEKRRIWDNFLYESRKSGQSVEAQNNLLRSLQEPRNLQEGLRESDNIKETAAAGFQARPRRLTEVALTHDGYQALSINPNVRQLGEELSDLLSSLPPTREFLKVPDVDMGKIRTIGEKIQYAATIVRRQLAHGDFTVPLIEAARLYLATLEHESQSKLMESLNRATAKDDAEFIQFKDQYQIDAELEVGLLLLSRLQSVLAN